MNLAPITLSHGERFGKLTVLQRHDKNPRKWEVGCECGHRFLARRSHLMNGRAKACERCSASLIR